MTRRNFGPSRSRRTQPLRAHQPRLAAKTPRQVEAEALRAEAAQTWSTATGQPAHLWLGPMLDVREDALIPLIQDALKAGASADVRGAWVILTIGDKRLVVSSDLLSDVLRHASNPLG